MGKDRSFIKNEPEKYLMLDIYLDKKAKFVYKDDFETIKFNAIRENGQIKLNIDKPGSKKYKFIFNNINTVSKVSINGETLKGYKINKNKLEINAVLDTKTTLKIEE